MPAALSPFKQAAAQAVASALGVDASILMATQPPDAALGDLAVGCFPAAKALKAAPPQLAQKAAAAFTPTELLSSAVATGPYVNFKLDRGAVYRHLFAAALGDKPELIPQSYGAGKTVCVDFSSPNIAKQLAYHHIRSTVLGHALVNLHRALGYKVVGINHLGDWGTTFGMIIAGIQEWGAPEPFDIEGLNAVYVRFRAAAKEDKALEDKGRQWFKKLEEGDELARALWQRIRDVSWAEFDQIYQQLDIHFDEVRGEAAYEHAMPGVISMLESKGLTSISEDALVVDLSAEGMPPLLLRKNDGATLYATRDLAAALYRWETYHPDKSLYVVGTGQALHFKQLFRVLARAGYEWSANLVHVPFGIVKIQGKMTATRSGVNVVLLRDVLAEAQAKVKAEIAAKSSELQGERLEAVAQQVGIGAVVFANLSSQREKDVEFEMDQVTSLSGDTAPYVQYAHARTAGILRKAGNAARDLLGADASKLTTAEEWALALLLTELPDVSARAAEALEPHHVTRYLLDVCAAYSRWYALGNDAPELRVVCADAETSRARLALNGATRETLRVGLGLLGISAPDEM